MISIRRTGPRTARRVLPLIEAQYREHEIAMGGQQLAAALGLLLRDPGRGFVLEARDGAATCGVAVVSFTLALEHGGKIAWLDELFVAPAARGAGVGSLLLESAVAGAAAAGCRTVELEVEASHARAARLYRREGFRKLTRARYSRALPAQ